MTSPLVRRLAKIEQAAWPPLPWHLPANQWTDAQLLAVAMPGRTEASDEELRAIAAADAVE